MSTARERVLAFLAEWPKGHQHPDDIYINWHDGEEHVLRKSDILEAIGARVACRCGGYRPECGHGPAPERLAP